MIPTWTTARDGSVYLNSLSRYVKGDMLVPPVAQNPLVTAAAPAAAIPTISTPVIFEGGEDAVTEIFSIIGAHDPATDVAVQNRLEIEITDKAYRRRYMNRSILANHVFGSNLQPFFLNESILLESQQTMIFQFFNRSIVGASTFRMAMETRKFQASALAKDNVTQEIAKLRQRKTFLTPYWLTSREPITLPAGGTGFGFFENSRDNFFFVFEIMCQIISTGAAGDVQEAISFRILDATDERPLMDRDVTLNTGTGTANFPYVLPAALLLEPSTVLRIDFTNLITDQPTDVFFTLGGVTNYVARENPWAEMIVDSPAKSMPVMGAP